MSNFLLEVYSEDIPSSAQILAEKEIYNLFKGSYVRVLAEGGRGRVGREDKYVENPTK